MSEKHEIAQLIPWYANGSLEASERERVERHLAECDPCRDLLRQAKEHLSLAALDRPPESMEHVQPRLLTQYVEDPESLELETVRWIEQKLETCDTCREAAAVLREVGEGLAETGPVQESPGLLDRAWQALASTVLRPEPAIAYLAALLVLAPLVWMWRASGDGAAVDPFSTPSTIGVPGERATRDEPGALPPPPLEIAVTPGHAVLLELRTDLTSADLLDPGLAFDLELRRDGEVVWSEPREKDEFFIRNGRAVLTVLFDVGTADDSAVHEIVIRARKPGNPLDGQALFRRSLRIVGG